MTDVILIVIATLLGVIVAVLIPTLIELRRSALRTQRFLDEMAVPLSASLAELRETLRSVGGVAEDARRFSSALLRTAEDMSRVAASVESLTRGARVGISAFRVGLNVAWDVLLRNLLSTRGGKS